MKNKPIASVKVGNIGKYLLGRLSMRLKSSYLNSKCPKVKKLNGKEIDLNLSDIDQMYLYNEHIREPENIFVYKAMAIEGLCNTFVDVGANFGHDALLIKRDFEKIILIEPNPNAANVLKILFKEDKNIRIIKGAIVNKESPRDLILKIPRNSSALASLGKTHLMPDNYEEVECKGFTIDQCLDIFECKAYIKIDVEGAEYEILKDIVDAVVDSRTIVGFEALSREYAVKCSKLFKDYSFFYSRFDFLNDDGSLFSSPISIFEAMLGFKNTVSIYEADKNSFCSDPDNFSQVYCVPVEKRDNFLKSMVAYSNKVKKINLIDFSHGS